MDSTLSCFLSLYEVTSVHHYNMCDDHVLIKCRGVPEQVLELNIDMLLWMSSTSIWRTYYGIDIKNHHLNIFVCIQRMNQRPHVQVVVTVSCNFMSFWYTDKNIVHQYHIDNLSSMTSSYLWRSRIRASVECTRCTYKICCLRLCHRVVFRHLCHLKYCFFFKSVSSDHAHFTVVPVAYEERSFSSHFATCTISVSTVILTKSDVNHAQWNWEVALHPREAVSHMERRVFSILQDDSRRDGRYIVHRYESDDTTEWMIRSVRRTSESYLSSHLV